MRLLHIYKKLFAAYGPQGWWPAGNGFDPPQWEICLGAILTQNTAWANVQKALANLRASGCRGPESILSLKDSQLEKIVRPAGFYRQKARKLKRFSKFFLSFGNFKNFSENVTREGLLSVNGIGPETADSVLLYACGRPVFVIDGYTKRLYSRLFGKNISDYNELQDIFQHSLPRDVQIYKEFHALIVALAKRHCKARPACNGCIFSKKCSYLKSQKRCDAAKA